MSHSPSPGTRWFSTIRRFLREAIEDDLPGGAAKIAYYFFLSLFPLVLVVFALTGLTGGDAAFERLTGVAQAATPQYAWQFVRALIAEITNRDRPGLLSFGILMTLWATSSGIVALTNELNELFGVEERRPWWRRRLLALAVLCSALILLVLGAAALIPSEGWVRGAGLGPVWRFARWPLGLFLPAAAAWLAYRYLPARRRPHSIRGITIGAVGATTLWVTATLLFRFYVSNFSNYDRTYGAVGAVIALLVWFHIAALSVLFGGKLASVLERQRALSDIERPVARPS